MPTERPLVSVVIPVYDAERYLAEALDSVLAQEYEPIEVIVVDDGSQDASSQIARSYKEIRLIRQENQGLAAARNAGIDAATGDFLAFHDADDIMLPSKMGAQARYLLDHPDVGYVLCRQELFFESQFDPRPWMLRDAVFGDPGGVAPTTGMIRRTALETAGAFDPNFCIGMEWLGRLREAGVVIAVLPEVLLRRRVHEENLTNSNQMIVREFLHALKGKIDRSRAAARDDTAGR